MKRTCIEACLGRTSPVSSDDYFACVHSMAQTRRLSAAQRQFKTQKHTFASYYHHFLPTRVIQLQMTLPK